MDWLGTHSEVLNVIASYLTLLVWLFYAQLLYFNFKRQRRSRLLINRGRGRGMDALCLISNMSSEAIYTTHIIAALRNEENEFTCDVTEYDSPGEVEEGAPLSNATRQGPLGSGEYSHIGTFNSLVRRVANAHGIELQEGLPAGDLESFRLEIRIIAIYGSEDKPIGAYKSFRFAEGGKYLVPESFDTNRLSKWWWGQSRLYAWINQQT